MRTGTSVVMIVVMLFDLCCVSNVAAKGQSLLGAGVSGDSLILGEFVTAVYVDRKGKKTEASGYIKFVDCESFTIGKGLWKEEILYSRVISIELPSPVFRIGSRVRVSSFQETIGTLISVSPDSLVIRPEYGERVILPRDVVTGIEVSGGVRTRAAAGTVLGLVTGVAAGIYVASEIITEERRSGTGFMGFAGGTVIHHNVGEGMAVCTLISVAGIFVGRLIGRNSKKEVWRKTSLNRIQIGALPAEKRPSLLVSISF
jgi:hypothetical protein